MTLTKSFLNLIPVIMLLALFACGKKSEEAKTEQLGSIAAHEEAGAPTVEIRVPDDAALQSILQTQQAIVADPASEALRRELGRKAIDNAARLIWTVGAGRVADPSSALALSNAERAAWADGNRWAAYLIEWQKNDFSTPFGSVHAQVPGSVIERKSMSDTMCVALVKTNLP